MKCPKCNSENVIVYNSRTYADNHVWRRRKCLDCEYRFSTKELTLTEIAQLENRKRK